MPAAMNDATKPRKSGAGAPWAAAAAGGALRALKSRVKSSRLGCAVASAAEGAGGAACCAAGAQGFEAGAVGAGAAGAPACGDEALGPAERPAAPSEGLLVVEAAGARAAAAGSEEA